MWKKAFLLVGISFEALFLIWFSVYIGQKADRHFHTNMGITLALVILALLIWFYQLTSLFIPKGHDSSATGKSKHLGPLNSKSEERFKCHRDTSYTHKEGTV